MSNYQQIQEKITKLRDIYLEDYDQKQIDAIEKALRTKVAASKIADNDIAKELIKDAVSRIKDINFLLAYDRKLTEVEREGLFKERIVHQWWLDRFGVKNLDNLLKSLEEYVDEKLK